MNSSKLTIIKLEKDDVHSFQKLIEIFHTVFETDQRHYANDSHLKKLLENPNFILLVIKDENEIVGGLTAYELPQYYSEKSELFLYDLAIKQVYQRKGYGKLLLSKLKDYCKIKDIKTLFVEAHEEDIYAINFYKSTGGMAERVVHFNYNID